MKKARINAGFWRGFAGGFAMGAVVIVWKMDWHDPHPLEWIAVAMAMMFLALMIDYREGDIVIHEEK